MSKGVLFQTVHFSITTQFSSIWSIDRSLPGATISGQGGPGSDVNDGVICILQSSSIIGTSPSDCLVSYPGHSLGGRSYPSAEVQSVYSTAPVDRVKLKWCNCTVAQTRLPLILSERSDFHMFDILCFTCAYFGIGFSRWDIAIEV